MGVDPRRSRWLGRADLGFGGGLSVPRDVVWRRLSRILCRSSAPARFAGGAGRHQLRRAAVRPVRDPVGVGVPSEGSGPGDGARLPAPQPFSRMVSVGVAGVPAGLPPCQRRLVCVVSALARWCAVCSQASQQPVELPAARSRGRPRAAERSWLLVSVSATENCSRTRAGRSIPTNAERAIQCVSSHAGHGSGR